MRRRKYLKAHGGKLLLSLFEFRGSILVNLAALRTESLLFDCANRTERAAVWKKLA